MTQSLEGQRVPVVGGELFVGLWPAHSATAPSVIAEGHDLNHHTLMLSDPGSRLVADELARYF